MTYDQRLMDRCIQHALKNPIQSRGRNTISRMAALITNGYYDYLGWNKYKTHPLAFQFSQRHDRVCLHAELDALVKYFAGNHKDYWESHLKYHDIYIARVLKNGTPALAKPCDTCFGALSYFGIRDIYWTT